MKKNLLLLLAILALFIASCKKDDSTTSNEDPTTEDGDYPITYTESGNGEFIDTIGLTQNGNINNANSLFSSFAPGLIVPQDIPKLIEENWNDTVILLSDSTASIKFPTSQLKTPFDSICKEVIYQKIGDTLKFETIDFSVINLGFSPVKYQFIQTNSSFKLLLYNHLYRGTSTISKSFHHEVRKEMLVSSTDTLFYRTSLVDYKKE